MFLLNGYPQHFLDAVVKSLKLSMELNHQVKISNTIFRIDWVYHILEDHHINLIVMPIN